MSRKTTTKMSSGAGGGGTVIRAPSYFVWNHRKHATSSPRPTTHSAAANSNMNSTQDQDGTVGEAGPSPRKMRSPRRRTTGVAGADNQSTDTKSSVLSGDSGGMVTISPKHKDPDRIKKDREREERVRQARERLEEERKRKLIDLQEQQRQAQENREKQLEMRRKKIEDLRRRDVERRAEVEKRRRERENADRSRRETLLMRAEERVARYEAWKRSGQKGPPPGGVIPSSAKHLSASTSVLYHKRNSGFTSTGVLNDSNRPESMLAPSAPPPSRPKSVVTLNVSTSSSSSGAVKLRENKSPRKPRPASVGTSMPSFVTLEQPRSSPRSKSTDRLARERTRARGSGAGRPGEEKDEKKGGEKSGVKMSRRTLERLSTPRQMASIMGDKKEPTTTPRREVNVARMSGRKAFSTSDLAMSPKKSGTREKTPKETTPKPPPPTATPSSSAGTTTSTTSTTSATATPSTPSRPSTRTPVRVVSPTPAGDEDGGSTAAPQAQRSTPSTAERSSGDISAEEYKAKLAEKRRQAREKAEREAEEERKRQEELERQEEERRQKEEEEQRRRDEEALRLAEEARKAEEERLQKAIEAEEARRAEEAARLEQERLAKEEADRKAKEEAERMEQEKQEKARREEEERLERKKRLEMIMKRVKTDSPGEGAKDAPKSLTSSPARSVNSTASSDTSPTEPENKTVLAMAAQSAAVSGGGDQMGTSTEPLTSAPPGEDSSSQQRTVKEDERGSPVSAPSPVTTSDQQTVPEPEKAPNGTADRAEPGTAVPDQASSVSSSPAPPAEGVAERPKFKSPLLQKLVEGKEDANSSASGGPRFKSPLLQNLLGKTKARSMGSSQDHSASDPNLSHIDAGDQGGGGNGHAPPFPSVMTSSMVDMSTSDPSQKEAMNSSEEKDVDTSEDSSSSHSSPSWVSGKHVSNGNEEISSIAVSAPSQEDVQPEPMEISTPMDTSATPAMMASSTASFWSGQDSGVSLGSDDLRLAAPSGSLQVSFNGHGPSRLTQSQGLEDSSISMRSVESVSSSMITDSAAGSVFSSVTSLPPGHVQGHQSSSAVDKDFEELIDLPVNNKTSPTTCTVVDNTDDLVNFNKLEEGSEETTAVPPPPIIAFEDRRQDVPDLLS